MTTEEELQAVLVGGINLLHLELRVPGVDRYIWGVCQLLRTVRRTNYETISVFAVGCIDCLYRLRR